MESGFALIETFVERLDPVAHRQTGRGLQMRLAADVGGQYRGRRVRGERIDLVGEQALRDFRLQDRVRARRSAAQVRVRHRREVEAQIREQGFHATLEFHAVLKGAGRVKSQ